MAHSVVMVPVPDLESVVRPRLARRCPDSVPTDPHDTVAAVTLVSPFVPLVELTDGVLAELDRFFADVTPFEFTLTGLHTFPDGTVYLSPSPTSPFRHLTAELVRLFPEYPPYGGAFDEVVPHLSVPVPEDESIDALEWELAPRFPLQTYAQEATLYWDEPGASRTLARFPFGTSAA